jgi:hypothetical protein
MPTPKEWRVFFAPPVDWGAQLELACSDASGQIGDYTVDLTSALLFERKQSSLVGYIRPALTGDPLSYSQQELIQAGYPRRPNPSSDMYHRWLRAVSIDVTVVPEQLIAAPATSYYVFKQTVTLPNFNWAGAVLAYDSDMSDNNGLEYLEAQADFTVPSFTTNISGQNAGFWAGLGGYISNDAGPIQTGITLLNSSSYQSWIEYGPARSQTQNNIVPHANDEMFIECYASDATGYYYDDQGSHGTFAIIDDTTGLYSGLITLPMPSNEGLSYLGESADFIMEDDDAPIPNFGEASMYVDAYGTDGNWHDFGTDSLGEISLDNRYNVPLMVGSYSGSDQATVQWKQAQ